MIYLDNAATTYPKPEVVYNALDEANRYHAFNIGRGVYRASDEAFAVVYETRHMLAELSGVPSAETVFSSSATEALNQIIYGLPLSSGDCVYISPFEHNAIVRPLHVLQERKGIKVKLIPFDEKTWNVDFERLRNQFAIDSPKAVFVSQISNTTGYLLPYEKIFSISREYSALNVLDAAQGFGIVPIKGIIPVDFIVFAGHKSLYASFGIAGFINRTNLKLNVVKAGGTGSDSLNPSMPDKGSLRYEAGSLNTVSIYGLNASLKWLVHTDIEEHERALTAYAINELKSLKSVRFYVPEDTSKIFGIISFGIDEYSPAEIGTILSDEGDIAVRTGYHCAPYVHDFIKSRNYDGTIRISFGYNNRKEDVDELVRIIRTL